jgi:hypothetical protein
MSPTVGELGKLTVKAPPEVSQKYPSPDVAVSVAVLIAVCQSTVPVLPKPV